MCSGHISLPDLSFLAFAVADEGEDLRILAEVLGTQRHADGDGHALTERARGGVHAGDLFRVGVALQDGVELAEVRILVAGDKALSGEHRVVAGGGVTLGEHEAVAVGIVRVLGVNAHVVEENAGHQFHRGQRTAGVAAAGVGGHRDDVAPHLPADGGKLFCIHGNPP